MSDGGGRSTVSLCVDVKQFFRQSLNEALIECHVETYPVVESYLVDILEYYSITERLYDAENDSGRKTRDTLAEMLLKANSSSPRARIELLKKLGDSSLYISGFFGDSLQRKVVDVDYYIDMGSTAYSSLSHGIYEDTFAKLYKEIAFRFNQFVDVFAVMSRRTMTTDGDNIFRMMDIYAKTGSQRTQETLIQKGVFVPPPDQIKRAKNQ
ncbi:MAG: hypothetical protein K2Q26_01405 [Bdellovibrionales bacterium]|nr:hypothetical protein [Bdellovibrionales bacterium]